MNSLTSSYPTCCAKSYTVVNLEVLDDVLISGLSTRTKIDSVSTKPVETLSNCSLLMNLYDGKGIFEISMP